MLYSRTCLTCPLQRYRVRAHTAFPTGWGLNSVNHSPQRKAALWVGCVNGPACCSPMQDRGIRQEIDDEKLYDGACSVYDMETYVRYAIQSSVPQSASGTSHSPQLSLFASLRTLTLTFAGGILAAFSFLWSLSQFQLEQRPGLYRSTVKAGPRCAGNPFL